MTTILSRLEYGWLLRGKRRAERGEGASEARGGKPENTTLTAMLGLQSETIDRRWRGASVVSVGRFGKSRQNRVSQGGDFQACGGGVIVLSPET